MASYVHARTFLRARALELWLLLVVTAVMSRFAVFAGCNGNLRKLATTLSVVVILARINVAHNSLLIFHNSPPAKSVGILPLNNTWSKSIYIDLKRDLIYNIERYVLADASMGYVR